jgi:uncharacterized protein (TIGR03437 family)
MAWMRPAGLCAVLATCLAAQTGIGTIAGTGAYGFSGDNGSAASARFDEVYALARDAQGNVYIADCWNHRVRKIAPGGTITTFAGNGTQGFAGDTGQAASAQLSFPRGLALDSQGNLYVADGGNSRVRKVTPAGVISTVAGNGTDGFSGDGGAATSAMLKGPRGLAVDSSGNLYIGDAWNFRVRKVTTAGIISTFAGTGTHGSTGDGGQAAAAQVGAIQSMVFDSLGNLFLADAYNHNVRKITPAGVISTVAGGGGFGTGGDGGMAQTSQLGFPRGLAVDAENNLYIADAQNHRIRKVTPAGAISTVAGLGVQGFSGDNGPSSCAQLQYPYGLAVDAQGALLIADLRNYRLRRASVEAAPARPVAFGGGLISAAGGHGLVAPGSLIALYGADMSAATCIAPSAPWALALGGASIVINDRPIPLYFASPGQINAQLPSNLAAGPATARVAAGGALSDPVNFTVSASGPSIFTIGGSQGAIVNQNGLINGPGQRATRTPGSWFIVYGTGPGAATPPVTDGQAAGGDPLSLTNVEPTATIGGAAARVLWSGMAPGFVGLWQMNVEVPTAAPAGAAVPLRVTMAGNVSNEISVALQ